MGSLSIWHWLIVLAVVLVLFGGSSKISSLMGDFAKGIKSFKKNMGEDESMEHGPNHAATPPQMVSQQGVPQPGVGQTGAYENPSYQPATNPQAPYGQAGQGQPPYGQSPYPQPIHPDAQPKPAEPVRHPG